MQISGVMVILDKIIILIKVIWTRVFIGQVDNLTTVLISLGTIMGGQEIINEVQIIFSQNIVMLATLVVVA